MSSNNRTIYVLAENRTIEVLATPMSLSHNAGPNIVSMAFNGTNYSGDDPMFCTIRFDREVTWTGYPYIVLSVGQTVYQLSPSNVNINPPGTSIAFGVNLYYNNIHFPAGQLVWGNPITTATNQYSLSDVNLLFSAVVPGLAANDTVGVLLGVQLQAGGNSFSGYEPVPGCTVVESQSGEVFYFFVATDSDGNITSTIGDLKQAIIDTGANAFIGVTSDSPDDTVLSGLYTQYSGAVQTVLSPSGWSTSGTPSYVDNGLNAFDGLSVVLNEGSTFTYNDGNGAPSLSFPNPPSTALISFSA